MLFYQVDLSGRRQTEESSSKVWLSGTDLTKYCPILLHCLEDTCVVVSVRTLD